MSDGRNPLGRNSFGEPGSVVPQREWVATGEQQRVDQTALVDRMPDFNPRTGDHLWMVATCYRVVPEQWQDATHTPMLDSENLLSITVPGCYHCEKPWSPRLASRRCVGHG
jgi:hypothetical protein